jgi:hypothetical protein
VPPQQGDRHLVGTHFRFAEGEVEKPFNASNVIRKAIALSEAFGKDLKRLPLTHHSGLSRPTPS